MPRNREGFVSERLLKALTCLWLRKLENVRVSVLDVHKASHTFTKGRQQ